ELGRDGDAGQPGSGLAQAEAFVREEPEELGADDGTADGRAELVAAILGQCGGRQVEGPGVEPVVTDKPVGRAVQRVAAGLRDDIHLTARGAPVLGWEDARLHLKLGDRVDGGRVTQAAVVGVDVGSAIQEKLRIVGAASGYAEAADQSLTIL